MGALALKRLLKKPIRKLLDTRKFISGLCLHLLHVTNDNPKIMTSVRCFTFLTSEILTKTEPSNATNEV